jgi:glycosyltransferase involved in cell wall biosynthesis
MKIGILIDRLNVGGVEKIAIEEVKALRKIGEDAYLVVLREKAVVPNACPDLLQGVPVVYLDSRLPKLLRFSVPVPGFSFFSSFHLTYPFFLPFVLKKKEFDYFISHGTYTSISAVAIRKVKKIKLSAFIWDPASYILGRVYKTSFPNFVLYFFKKLAYVLDKFLINNVDNVLVGGDAHNSFIHKINPHKPIKTIYPSVHPIKKLVKKENYILMVTAWKNGKNPEYIFELASKLPKASFKMVGRWVDPLYREKFEASLSEKGLTKQVHVVGGVSEAELAHYYAHACVLLQTNDDRG